MRKLIKQLIVSLISFFIISHAVFAAVTDLDQSLNERVNKKYNIGIVVAIIDAKGTHYYHAGNLSREPGAPIVDQGTLFPLASVTKVFTTLLLADGVQRGLFKLTDPAQKYLTQVKLPTFGKNEITLEQLATHTSGLPSRLGTINENDPYIDLTQHGVYELLSSYRLTRSPGKKYEYGDLSMGLLADAISTAENTPYESLIKSKITTLLGMSDTKVIASHDDTTILVSGYKADDSVAAPYHFPVFQAAGAMYSTASDMIKFVGANAGIIQSNLYPAMKMTHIPRFSEGQPQHDFDYPGTEKLEAGLGWNIDTHYNLVWKNGNISGFSSFIGFNRKTKQGVVVLANTGNVIYTDNLGMHILNNKVGLFPLYQEIILSASRLRQFAGTYQMADGTYYRFRVEGNHLKAQHITQLQTSSYFNIYPKSPTQFFGRIADAVFRFSITENGVMGFELTEGGKTQRALKTKALKRG